MLSQKQQQQPKKHNYNCHLIINGGTLTVCEPLKMATRKLHFHKRTTVDDDIKYDTFKNLNRVLDVPDDWFTN